MPGVKCRQCDYEFHHCSNCSHDDPCSNCEGFCSAGCHIEWLQDENGRLKTLLGTVCQDLVEYDPTDIIGDHPELLEFKQCLV